MGSNCFLFQKRKENENKKERKDEIKAGIIHNKDSTLFFSGESGERKICLIEHPNYNRAYHEVALPLAAHFVNQQGKYLADK